MRGGWREKGLQELGAQEDEDGIRGWRGSSGMKCSDSLGDACEGGETGWRSTRISGGAKAI